MPVDTGSVSHPAGGSYIGHWVGRFIWTECDPDPYHFFLMARRAFRLHGRPSSATLHVTADDRYALYINGQYLGRGPARGEVFWKSYDSYDVAPHLHDGGNAIAVLAYYYGCHNARTRDDRCYGLFAQLEYAASDGSKQVIVTDNAWHVRRARGWDRRARRGSLGVNEIYDANLDPPGRVEPGFDDSSWDPARVLPFEGPWTVSRWRYLEPRGQPGLSPSMSSASTLKDRDWRSAGSSRIRGTWIGLAASSPLSAAT